MFELETKALNIDRLQRQFSFLGENTNKWIAKGMTDTIKDSTNTVRRAIPQHIDRPTRWTMRSLFFFPAEKDDLRAAVAFKWEFGRRPRSEIGLFDAPQSMAMQVYGGGRKLKEFEKRLKNAGISPPSKPYLVPAKGAEKDRHGNVKAGFMNKVFYGRARGGSANLQPFSGGGRSRSRDAKAGIRYFVHPNKKGIYRTVTYSSLSGSQVTDIRPYPVFLFSAQPQYSPRFDFFGIANKGARNLERDVAKALDQGVKRYLGR